MAANTQTPAPDSGTASAKAPRRDNGLLENDKRFQALVQASSDVVYRMNADWTKMHLLIGRDFIADTEEENCNWLQKYILPDDQPQVMAAINEAIRTKQVFELEHRVVRVDGSIGWTSSRAVPVLDENGTIVEWFGMAGDITARHETQERLRTSEALFRTIIENSRDGINMLDLTTGRYVFMSPSQVALTGFTAEEIMNISAEEAYDRVHPDDREISVRQQQEVAAGNDNPSPVEYRWKVKSGEYRWFSDTRKIVRDAEGKAVALVGISRDITDRKRIEAALEQSHDELKEKTIALEEALEQTKQVSFELVWAEERERERIAGELHDQVGQSLLLAQMKLSSLEHDVPSGPQHDVLSEIRELVNRSISDIRTLTFRMRPPLLETAGLDMTFNWLCSTIGSDYGADIEFISDGGLKNISSHLRYPLYQAVRELLVNAMKHASAAKVQLVATSEESSLVIAVVDNGTGFDRNVTQKALLSKNSYGLFNVQQRIERMNGTLTIESVPDKGTVATIRIPVT